MDLLNTFGVLLLTTLFLIWIFLRQKFKFWKKKDMETPEVDFLLGNFKGILLQKHSFADQSLKFYSYFKSKGLKHGGVYILWVPVYLPVDINIIKHIMQIDFQHFVDRGVYLNEKSDPLSAHLFSIEGTKWKLLRRKLTPTFTSGKMKMMYETMLACTGGLCEVMDNEMGKSVNIKEILGRFTTDIIGSVVFGLECNSLTNPESEFRVKGKSIFERNFIQNLKQFVLFVMPDICKKLDFHVIDQDVSDFFLGVVRDTVAYREKNNITRKDFMQLLIQLRNSGKLVDDDKETEENIAHDDNKITINEIAAQAFIFFEAGFETSSTTMTFCLYELAKNKSIQDKVRTTIKRVLAEYNNEFTYEAAMQMHYLDQVINETLRKYPPLPSLNRVCTKDYKIPGTDIVLEKGLKVMIPLLGIHRDPEIYPDPDKFDPDRFLEENIRKREHFTFLPFGDGPRVCIGTRFGLLQTKVGLVTLLLNYEFSVSPKTKEPIQFDRKTFFTSTLGGMWLNFQKIVPESIVLYKEKV